MNAQITNLALILGLMQVAKRIPFDDPNILNMVRAGYVLSNIIIVATYFYVGIVIKRKNDLTTMKYTEPAPPMSQDRPKEVTTTIRGYDETQLKAAYKSMLTGIAMMLLMHVYFKYTNPLFIQSIIPLKGLFENKLVRIHLLGKPALGDLKRPWKAPASPFAGFGASEPKEEKKSVEGEKSEKGGAKEE